MVYPHATDGNEQGDDGALCRDPMRNRPPGEDVPKIAEQLEEEWRVHVERVRASIVEAEIEAHRQHHGKDRPAVVTKPENAGFRRFHDRGGSTPSFKCRAFS
ncbi:hypothetical protein [Aurantimonas sp. Leaf443]|uniref:hypothetical protein n=1 Tax=Aurantimonas sp. Leaf443 TaxID=1736378 RepID=UPI0012E33B96|nr:hypothetical protein [Aurantimonas sp. Leaf443]